MPEDEYVVRLTAKDDASRVMDKAAATFEKDGRRMESAAKRASSVSLSKLGGGIADAFGMSPQQKNVFQRSAPRASIPRAAALSNAVFGPGNTGLDPAKIGAFRITARGIFGAFSSVANTEAGKIKAAWRSMEPEKFGAMVSRGFGLASSALQGFGSIVASVFRTGVQVMRAFAIGIGATVTGFGLFTKGAVEQAITFDNLKRGLTVATGSVKAMREEWAQLREVAKLPGLSLEGATQGALQLMGSGFTASGANRTEAAVGNAVASSGGTAEETKGVLRAMAQMSGKGKLMGDDLRQIAEHLPMIRDLLKQAFGTSNTESIQKMGLSMEQFMGKLLPQMEKIPKMTTGAGNAIENLVDNFSILRASFGESFFGVLDKATGGLSKFFNFLSESGVMAGIGKGFADSIERAFGDGSGITRFGFNLVAIFEKLPELISKTWDVVRDFAGTFAESMVKAFNTVGEIAVRVFNTINGGFAKTTSISSSFWEVVATVAPGLIGMNVHTREGMAARKGFIESLHEQRNAKSQEMTWTKIDSPKAMLEGALKSSGMKPLTDAIGKRTDELLAQFNTFKDKKDKPVVINKNAPILKDGGAGDPVKQKQVEYLRQIQDNTRQQVDISRIALGAGSRSALIGMAGDLARSRTRGASGSQSNNNGIRMNTAASDLERSIIRVIYEMQISLGVAPRVRGF